MSALLRLLPILLVTALAGCAQQETSVNSFKGSEKDVAQVIADLQSDAQGRKPEVICSDVLSRALADKLKASGGNDCTAEMEKIAGDADDYKLEVTDVAINGSTATAKVESRKGGKTDAETTFSLVREDGDWRLNDLGSSAR
jgi:hypothetical protein